MLPALVSEFNLEPDDRSAIITLPMLELPANFYKDSYYGEKTAHTRSSDGSMTIDTVVTGIGPDSSTAPQTDYQFVGNLKAITSGFDWSTNFLGNYINGRIDWSVDCNGVPSDPYGYPTGFNEDGQTIRVQTNGSLKDLPTTMNVNVKATDFRDGAVAENTYHINLHKPLENAHEIDANHRVFDHNELFPWSDWVQAGIGDATVSLVSQQPVPTFIQGNGNDIGMLVGGVAGSGLIALFLGPEAFVPAIIADMVCNAVGIALMKAGTPPPPQVSTQTANYAAYLQAVNEQAALDRNQHDPTIDDPHDRRIILDSTGPSIEMIAADPLSYWRSSVNPQAKCRDGIRMMRCMVAGDAYGELGYIGYSSYTIAKPGVGFTVWQFNLTGRAVP